MGTDIADIVRLAESHFQTEIDSIFIPEPVVYTRNLTYAVVNQFYGPNSELLSVAHDAAGKMIAYTWAKAGERAPWSDDEMVFVKMAHVGLDLSTKQRVRLIQDMLLLWENFALRIGVKIICSTTMRREQDAFLKLHERAGYDVRGSYCYKKLSA
jgi:hypothetical protein|tara:strand:+ start:300 stop:764 length:465 start_codon:yes stop_codon:yes gene_type:complete